MTKKITIITSLIILIIISTLLVVVYQKNKIAKQKNSDGSKIKTIALSNPIDAKSVIFENEKVVITFGLNDFESNLIQFSEKYPDIQDDKDLLTFIEEQSQSNSEIMISNMPKELQQRAEYRVADLLETGKFKLFDKKENIYIDKINIETYNSNCGHLCGSGGRRYFIPNDNVIFFEVMDWIS